jgi:hypothetical protein
MRSTDRSGRAWSTFIEDDFTLSVAAYRRDVLLVNPIADGLNLVARKDRSPTPATGARALRGAGPPTSSRAGR